MGSRIDDDMLKRLVSYEGYVDKLFCQVARSRWLDMKSDVVKDYEKLKALKKNISSLVDFAFLRYGVEHGLMKVDSMNMVSDLNEDLETLAQQLQKVEWDPCSPSTSQNFALVI